MALILALSEGQDFYTGDLRFVMGGRFPDGFYVTHQGVNYGITPHQWVTVSPGVELRASKNEGRSANRIQINAPTMLALKGTLYRKSQKENAP